MPSRNRYFVISAIEFDALMDERSATPRGLSSERKALCDAKNLVLNDSEDLYVVQVLAKASKIQRSNVKLTLY